MNLDNNSLFKLHYVSHLFEDENMIKNYSLNNKLTDNSSGDNNNFNALDELVD